MTPAKQAKKVGMLALASRLNFYFLLEYLDFGSADFGLKNILTLQILTFNNLYIGKTICINQWCFEMTSINILIPSSIL